MEEAFHLLFSGRRGRKPRAKAAVSGFEAKTMTRLGALASTIGLVMSPNRPRMLDAEVQRKPT